jgi:cytochrome oxidase Cu insertion factor (SCO1/SenC/PrrC family)
MRGNRASHSTFQAGNGAARPPRRPMLEAALADWRRRPARPDYDVCAARWQYRVVRLFYYAASSLRSGAGRLGLVLAALAIAAAGCGSATGGGGQSAASESAMQAAANPNLDPGSSLDGIPAPDFSLTNQFGQRISLSAFRGKVVILAFTDSECTTVCPLTTQSMLAAKDLLGKAGDQVQLLGIDANPAATKVSDVLAYSRSHGMVNQWDFLTGTLPELKAVWKHYGIEVQITQGQVDHTPALFVIDTRGREQKIYLTTMAYASITQAAQLLAQEAAGLLPGHPSLASTRSLAYIAGLSPAKPATLPALPSGSVTLGPGQPRLVVFFATWLTETSDLRSQLLNLSQYARSATAAGLPRLVAVDEEATEPSLATVRTYVGGLGALGYPVALDETGRLADGYGVQDQPWYVLTSATGKIIWKHDGWLPVSQLTAAVKAASR